MVFILFIICYNKKEVVINMFNDYLDEVFFMVLVTFLFSAIIMPFTNKVANHIGAIDVPKDKRRVHTKPIPKLGGLGIFSAFLFGYMLFGVQSIQMNSVLIGSFIIIITGILDDIKTLKAKHEFLGQFLAALTITLYGNIEKEFGAIDGITIDAGMQYKF